MKKSLKIHTNYDNNKKSITLYVNFYFVYNVNKLIKKSVYQNKKI